MKRYFAVLTAVLLSITVLMTVGCACKSQSTEASAFSVSIYKVEKEQDEDGIVYITNYKSWKDYMVTSTEMIDLPEYDPEKEDRDCKISYKNNYDYDDHGISGIIRGNFFECKNKMQFMATGDTTIFARERVNKTINFFYNGKNLKEYLSGEQLEEFNKMFIDTYEERFSFSSLRGFLQYAVSSGLTIDSLALYTKEGMETPFSSYHFDSYTFSYNYYFNLIKSTDVYVKITTKTN